MRLDPGEARRRFAASAVLRLATAGADGQPHLVPCTFGLDDSERVVIGIDSKPKSSPNLRRLRNIAENPRVTATCGEIFQRNVKNAISFALRKKNARRTLFHFGDFSHSGDLRGARRRAVAHKSSAR